MVDGLLILYMDIKFDCCKDKNIFLIQIQMPQTANSNTQRANGKRAVRPPLRFGDQHEYVPSKFGLDQSKHHMEHPGAPGADQSTFNEVDAANVLLSISEYDQRTLVVPGGISKEMDVSVTRLLDGSFGFGFGTSENGENFVTNVNQKGPAYTILMVGDQITEVNGYDTVFKTHQELTDMISTKVDWGGYETTEPSADKEQAMTVHLKIIRRLSIEESELYQRRLEKYGKVCAETNELCLGCEQDPSDMQWYSQAAWKRWTDAQLECPEGMIEWHSLSLKTDSWDMEVDDKVVFAQQIDSINDTVCRFKDAHNTLDDSESESEYRLTYTSGVSDEYALISHVYLGEDYNWELKSVYLVVSTGTVYPIDGSTDISSPDYNPIVEEVVGNLKRTLNGNYDPYDGDQAYYGVY